MADVYSTQSGVWSDGTTWIGGSAPGIDDHAIVQNSHTVDVMNPLTHNGDITIATGGALNVIANCTFSGNFSVASTCTLDFGPGTISLYGDVDHQNGSWLSTWGSIIIVFGLFEQGSGSWGYLYGGTAILVETGGQYVLHGGAALSLADYSTADCFAGGEFLIEPGGVLDLTTDAQFSPYSGGSFRIQGAILFTDWTYCYCSDIHFYFEGDGYIDQDGLGDVSIGSQTHWDFARRHYAWRSSPATRGVHFQNAYGGAGPLN